MDYYRVEIDSRARKEIRALPGHMRQRVIRLLRDLEVEPRPSTSRPLDATRAGIDLSPNTSLLRIRLEGWRVVYLIEEEWQVITVLAVRKRPPYHYADLGELLADE